MLLERLIVNRPHPWGLLTTLIDLIKSNLYRLGDYEFVRNAPDIERVFDSVAQQCMPEIFAETNEEGI